MTIGPTFEELNAEEQRRRQRDERLVGDSLREIIKYFSWKETCRFAILSKTAASIIVPRMRRALVDGRLTNSEGGRFTYQLDVSRDGGDRVLVEMEGNELKISIVRGTRNNHILHRELRERVIREGECIAAYNVHVSDKVLTVEGLKSPHIVPTGWKSLVVRAELDLAWT